MIFFGFLFGYSQKADSPWTKVEANNISQNRRLQEKPTENATYYQLDMALLKSKLHQVPNTVSKTTPVLLDFPNGNGTFEVFRIEDYSVMAPELQAKFPEIRSYVGYGLNNPATVVYFSVSAQGLHSMTLSLDAPTEYINPMTTDGVYKAFSRSALLTDPYPFECDVIEDRFFNRSAFDPNFIVARNANDGTRRTYRLAIGTSLEYTNFHGGTVAGALAAINTTMTRVNGIYDRELSIRMTLVANNDLLISTAGNSLFSNTENIALNTGIINGLIGSNSYDIGHSFTTGSGGRAYLSSVCANNKGGGTTGLSSPSGDPFAIDYVAHEMGHQFGATHTFNGTTGNCSGANRYSSTAYEPGSGSTIMSYSGICGPQNVQNNSSDYFHQASLEQIWTNITMGNGSCAVLTATGNTAPTAHAGASYSIPIATPYKLTGASTDADGTASHTFTWEQFDLGPAGMPTTTTEAGPMVRSFQGTSAPVRYIPRLQDVMAHGGDLSVWEKLPSIARDLNFTLTVRDNDPRGGQSAVDDMTVTAVASAGPFVVTSQNSNVTWEVGSTKQITWEVADTHLAPINVANVNIKLSIDGGATFPHTLATNIPNTGAYEVEVPYGTTTNQARVLVESVGNIFYNVNTSNFSIIDVEFLLNFSPTSVIVCQPDTAVYNFTYNTYLGFNQTTTFSATDLPPGITASFEPESASADGTPVVMTLSNTGSVAPGSYVVTATGVSGSLSRSATVLLDLFDSNISPITLTAPANGADGLYHTVAFSWEGEINVEDYLIEIATDANFGTLIEAHSTRAMSYTTVLAPATVYYWRVTGFNPCATGTTSEVFHFSTGVPTCNFVSTASDTPITITPMGSNVYNSVITIAKNQPVTDVNVKINVAHDMIGDLVLKLISPSGTEVLLADRVGGFFDQNFTETVFDQEASISITDGNSPFTGTFRPEGDLAALYGEMSAGDWTLQVADLFNGDGGSLNEFTLELCLAEPLAIDVPQFEAFAVFPNPNKGEFTVKFQSRSGQAIAIEVYDMRGRKLFADHYFNTVNFREVIRLGKVPSGMYLLAISDGQNKVMKKIMVNGH